MSKKINVAILFGGKSVEHEVSLQSGINVARALAPDRYSVQFIGIDKEGCWNYYDPECPVDHQEDPRAICLGKKGAPVNPFSLYDIDVVFPVLHGPLGEDGTVQGLLRLAEIPFVGADVLGSSVGMDKDVSKRLVSQARVATAHFHVLHKGAPINSNELNFPLFVKPARTGSSIGITKIHEPSELLAAVEKAFNFDEKVLLEEGVEGREIQVSVMGNQEPRASLPCEIIPKGEFHTYESKYIDKGAADFLYPAPLDSDEVQLIQALAIKVYQVLGCEGFARVDFFLNSQGEVYFNEINTIPGLTQMSPYAKMWQASGVSYGMMVDQLIRLALERHRQRSQLSTSIEVLTPS